MPSTTESIRVFGAPTGAAGVRVVETIGTNLITGQEFGGAVFWGVLPRGEPGVYVPCRSFREYLDLFGDANNPLWDLYDNGQLTPDAVRGYFNRAGDNGLLWLCRLELNNTGKKATINLRNRIGNEVLQITAANMGRWGGYTQTTGEKAIVVATPITFTLVVPGTLAGQYIGGNVTFSSGTSKSYEIVANTDANPTSGEVIFSVSPQYDLLSEGVNGPSNLTGTANYFRQVPLTGTIAAPALVDATGSIAVNNTAITGTGTDFLNEFAVGHNFYLQGEARVIQSVTSATTLTVSSAFSLTTGTGLTAQKDNLVVTGTGTNFTSDLVGKAIYVTISGIDYSRQVAAYISATSIILESAFPSDVVAGTLASIDNYTVTGVGSSFSTQLFAGDQIIDPSQQGQAVKVLSVNSDTSFTVGTKFSTDFTAQSLAKQTQQATVTLTTGTNEGLSVVITPGTKAPAVEFNLAINFNGNQVYSQQNLSLDPTSKNFIESVVNTGNLAYQFGNTEVYRWITVTSLLNGQYTTSPTLDVRPFNGGGDVLLAVNNYLFTTADIDYTKVIGNKLFPDPYSSPRSYFLVKASSPAIALEGTISSLGVNVTGTATNFTDVLSSGDYIAVGGNICQVRVVISDTSLILYTAFPSDLGALTQVSKAGYLQVDRGVNLAPLVATNNKFQVAYPTLLEGGYDGDLSSIIPYHYTQYLDLLNDDLERTILDSQMGLIRIATPGVSSQEVSSALAAFAEKYAYEARIEIPSNYTSAAAAESYVQNEVGLSDFISVAYPSYGFISDPRSAGTRLIPLTGDIMGLETYIANVHKGWHYPAAGENGVLTNFVSLTYDITSTDEALLNSSGIQPIKRINGTFTVYGARVPCQNSVYTFLHIRRIVSNCIWVLRKNTNILNQLFRPNDPSLAYQLTMILGNYFRGEYKNRVLNNNLTADQAFTITVDSPNSISQSISTNDSGDVLSTTINGNLAVYVSIVPSGIDENIYIFLGPNLTPQIN